jgi:hypothetical protein
MALLDQLGGNVGRLVCGDRAGDAEDDVHGISLAREEGDAMNMR